MAVMCTLILMCFDQIQEATKLVKKKSQLEILPNEFEPGTPLFDLDIPGIGTIQTAVAQGYIYQVCH